MNKINLQSGRSLLTLCAAVTPRIFERSVQQWYTSKKIPSQCPQNGRSMIEMLGVLAIIGVLSVGGIMGYSKAMMRYKINKTIEQITYIASNIRTTFANQGNYAGLTAYCPNNNCIAKKAHIFPEDMWQDGEYYPQTIFGSRVVLYEEQKNDADDSSKAFSMRYEYIPQEACIEILSHDWSALNLQAVNVCTDTDNELKMPATLDIITRSCTGWDEPFEDNVLEIAFYFDIDLSSEMYQEVSPMNGAGWRN